MSLFFKKKTLSPEAPISTTPLGSLLPTSAEPAVPGTLAEERRAWISKLKAGLRKTASGISAVFGGTRIDESLYEALENALLVSDAGVAATEYLLNDLKRKVKETGISHPEELKNLLTDSIFTLLRALQKPLTIGPHHPTVLMITGVNGAGKTTSIGKLSHHLSEQGHSVLLAAADTFRAAARDQLVEWAKRSNVDVISQNSKDPAAVSYDAVRAGIARGKDVVLIDTAGRLPTQLHLMEELKKIKRVIQKAASDPGNPDSAENSPTLRSLGTAPHEVLLVIDGATGQNALAQVRAFDDALGLTGLIITKLDGTAKGGILAAIARERPIPIYFIGVGENLDALQTFDAREFAQALLT